MRGKDGYLWALWGGSSWKDTEDEGPHFKIKGWIKVLADALPVLLHTHTQTH